MSEAFDLDRDTNISNNIDATGKKWNIYTERGRHLFFTRPDPDRADAVIPKDLQGRWTKRMLLDEAIRLYVRRSWDHADEIKAKNERKAQAAKEAQANARKETKVATKEDSKAKVSKQKSNDDEGSTSAGK